MQPFDHQQILMESYIKKTQGSEQDMKQSRNGLVWYSRKVNNSASCSMFPVLKSRQYTRSCNEGRNNWILLFYL